MEKRGISALSLRLRAVHRSNNQNRVWHFQRLKRDAVISILQNAKPMRILVSGEWMLLDGRNRREAAKIAGVIPPVIVTDIDPKLAVHRSNNQNRDATPGQKAMATAMAFPDGGVGGRGKGLLTLENCDLKSQFSRKTLERARYVLRNNPIPEVADYPQRCLDIMAGSLSQSELRRKVARTESDGYMNSGRASSKSGRGGGLLGAAGLERCGAGRPGRASASACGGLGLPFRAAKSSTTSDSPAAGSPCLFV